MKLTSDETDTIHDYLEMALFTAQRFNTYPDPANYPLIEKIEEAIRMLRNQKYGD